MYLGCLYGLLLQVRNISTLAETAIYVATVEKYTEVLREILNWVAENKEEVGDIKMENADCILHAALEDDKDQVKLQNDTITELQSSFSFTGSHFIRCWVQTGC